MAIPWARYPSTTIGIPEPATAGLRLSVSDSRPYSAAQLKTMQEVITLVVFCGFSVLYLKEPLSWNHAVGFALIAAGAAFVFTGRA